MYPIKQSSAITVPFFVHDASGDAVTGLTDGSFTKRISKNGAAFGAMTVTITEMENGWYSIPLSSSHSDTLGIFTVVFTNAGAKQVNLQFRVHARLPDDMAYPTTSGRSIDVTVGGAVGVDWGNVENQGTSVDLSATDIQLVDTCTTNTDMLTAAAVNAEVDTALADVNLDHLVGTATGIPALPAGTFLDIRTLASASYFDPAADTVANVTTVATLTGHSAQTGDSFARLGAPAGTSVSADISDIPTVSEFNAKIPDTISLAAINAEVVDVIDTDATTLPAQEAPSATPSLRTMLGWLYKTFRNRKEQTATEWRLYDDAGSTVDSKATVSDNGTTATKGEIATGP